MDPNAIGAELLKNPQFMEVFQKALGEGKIPDEKDPNRDKWLKDMQAKLQKTQQEETKKRLETPVTDEEGTWMWVAPEAGFCVKCSTTNGGKVFINVTQHSRIAEPIPIPDSEQDEEDTIKFKIPLSCGVARADVDKSGKTCKVYDVIVNPNTVKRCGDDNEFRRFVAALCMTWIKQKSEPMLNADEFKNVNFKCKGVPDPQRIRLSAAVKADNAMNGEIKLPDSKTSGSAPTMVGGKGERKLVEEISEAPKVPPKPQPSASVESAGAYLWAEKHPKPARSPYFRETVPDRFVLTVILPGITTIKEVDVQVKPKRVDFIAVDQDDGKPFFSVPLKYPVSEEPLHAKFIRATNTLILHLGVALPTDDKVVASRDAAEEEADEIKKEEAESQRRIAEQRAKFDRLRKEEEDVMKQRKEYVANINAVAGGLLPPSLIEEIGAMAKEQQQLMLLRIEKKVMKGDSIDELLTKMPPEAQHQLCRHLRSLLGLEQLPQAEKAQLPEPPISTDGAHTDMTKWADKMQDQESTETVEYNFAKKAERLFGVEMHNRYLFALDH
eukprot:GILI01011160.1.p1 GENE.GILI01011160.1~~GILI01011160.1.p1  ORF type:complete len:554 (+),score=107.98 GILI01011160.1:49-1710(+)